jgi:acyl-CoA dehydrogenase
MNALRAILDRTMTHSPPARQAQAFDTLLEAVRRIARSTAADQADQVDAQARFPQETLQALHEAGLLSAPIPKRLGGAGCGLLELGQICSTLAQGCGSSAMVLAMHYSQVACIARHAGDSRALEDYLSRMVEHQWLLASITSEVGTFGDTRSSICAVERHGDRFLLNKDATTGSYCAHADAIAVTCRRDAEAASSDQLLVLVQRDDARLTQTTTWDTLGMRGTCSPGFRLEANGPIAHIVPEAFADVSAQTMVPYAHTLWSSVWSGIAADAVRRAGQFVRAQARKTPGATPPAATRLAEVTVQLQTMKQHWQSVAEAVDALPDTPAGRQELSGIAWGLRLNNLKIASSEAAPQIVHRALQIVGILGYKNDSPFSLGRHYRDVLSASLMVSNERIASKNASMLLVLKDMP